MSTEATRDGPGGTHLVSLLLLFATLENESLDARRPCAHNFVLHLASLHLLVRPPAALALADSAQLFVHVTHLEGATRERLVCFEVVFDLD